jgi:hypothetical protein
MNPQLRKVDKSRFEMRCKTQVLTMDIACAFRSDEGLRKGPIILNSLRAPHPIFAPPEALIIAQEAVVLCEWAKGLHLVFIESIKKQAHDALNPRI